MKKAVRYLVFCLLLTIGCFNNAHAQTEDHPAALETEYFSGATGGGVSDYENRPFPGG